MGKVIWIRYETQEVGPAELLQGRVARIVDAPMLNWPLSRDAVVLLDRLPSGRNGTPEIEKVLYNPWPCWSLVSYAADEESVVLHVLLMALRAEITTVCPPKDERPGRLVVRHPEHLDPVMLARGLGIEQPVADDRDAEDEDTEAEEDDLEAVE
jgi:hypothetical protein